MNAQPSRTTAITYVVAFIAVIFGVLTIYSGGAVLFGDGAARQAAGNYVSFVVWFNFISGFVYIAAGIGLYLNWQNTAKLSIFMLLATALVFIAFGIHILFGGGYEWRTVGAMVLRNLVWLAIALYSRALWNKEASRK